MGICWIFHRCATEHNLLADYKSTLNLFEETLPIEENSREYSLVCRKKS